MLADFGLRIADFGLCPDGSAGKTESVSPLGNQKPAVVSTIVAVFTLRRSRDVACGSESRTGRRRVGFAALDVALVWLVFVAYGAWPTPDVNEAHYLTKAKHYWDPAWCRRDLFLESADSHVVFYATLGVLPHLLPLPTAAWVGRFVVWTALACGWRRLSFALVPRFGVAAVSAMLALALNHRGSMAGEWFVGGVEAKGIAYACVFFGLADVVAARWRRGLPLLGAATAFHVLVGGWSLAATALAWLCDRRDERPRAASLLPAVLATAALAAFGVVPGLLLTRNVDAATVAEANRFLVGSRIAHHLYPPFFLEQFGLRHAALWAAYLAACCALSAAAPRRRLRTFVCASGLFSLVGLGIALVGAGPQPWAAGLLKFYWFRLADVAVAVGASLELAAAAAAIGSKSRRLAAWALLTFVGGAHLASQVQLRMHSPMGRGERLFDAVNLSDWRDVCRWFREHTPTDALVLTPRSFQSFKWYAERAEFATWKDMPQDAASLVAWSRRLADLYGEEDGWVQFFPRERIVDVCRRYEVDYVVTYGDPPIALPAAYRNNTFTVYRPFPDSSGSQAR